mgnify:CR=1 FL=1
MLFRSYTASTSGISGSQFSPVYSAVKHGVVGLVRGLAKRYAKEKIRVNAICPGPIDTPMLRVFVARPDSQMPAGETPETLVQKRGGTVRHDAVAWGYARAADALDQIQARGRPLGSLHGIPVSIKDLFNVSGMPTRASRSTASSENGDERNAIPRSRARARMAFSSLMPVSGLIAASFQPFWLRTCRNTDTLTASARRRRSRM